ncbi:phytase [Undibacterium seohonense]|uniref:Phytase n=1 Tax=Undibacterium seohonense TaxID=1344950 RepID=A0ABR6X1K1_9BURK|nr:phytase [Undibacterium seohonense]MBC3806792.1 phytase [Undibacterium seohonense]
MQTQKKTHSQQWQRTLCAAMLITTALTVNTSSANSPAPTLPEFVKSSLDFRQLNNGDWLILDKKSLRLLSASGVELTSMKVRAKQFDVRESANYALAALIDSDTQNVLPIRIQQAQFQLQTSLPAATSALESSCLYRDQQQLMHLFVIAKSGHAQQWILEDNQARLVRNLALPANAKSCEVDDRTETLYVNEEDFGVWAYAAQSESHAARGAVELRQPYGRLQHGAHAIHAMQNGIAILDAAGSNISLSTSTSAKQDWKINKQFSKKTHAAWPQKAGILRSVDTPGKRNLFLRDDSKKTWIAITSLASKVSPVTAAIPVLLPQAQTEEMSRLGDAADDPAIWRHPLDSQQSRILGTNKKQGLLVYDMQGKQTQLLEVGRLNNVDVRQQIQWQDGVSDIAIATQRDDHSLVIFDIDQNGSVREVSRIATGLKDIYGTCLYQPSRGGLEAFVNDKDGVVQHWRIERKNSAYQGTQLRQMKIATQPEGCVVDDKNARLFIGEEKRGVWLTNADVMQASPLKLIAKVGEQLHADVEGLALYHGKKETYLVVSSQGDNSYVIYDAQAPFRYRGKFRIGFNIEKGIDGSSETDGLEVSSASFGTGYEDGILVVQDGHKHLPDGAQNFKYINWKQIAKALQLP